MCQSLMFVTLTESTLTTSGPNQGIRRCAVMPPPQTAPFFHTTHPQVQAGAVQSLLLSIILGLAPVWHPSVSSGRLRGADLLHGLVTPLPVRQPAGQAVTGNSLCCGSPFWI